MSLRDFGLLALVCLVWASNNIVSKYVVSHLGSPPLFYATARFAVVAIATLPWLLPMPRPRLRLITVALLMGGGNFALHEDHTYEIVRRVRAATELGWQATTPFVAGVSSYVDWLAETSGSPTARAASMIAGNAAAVLAQEPDEL